MSTLPGSARFASVLNVFHFLRATAVFDADYSRLHEVGPAAVHIAQAEGLPAHANAVAIRLGADGLDSRSSP